ncbi:MAG: response regulator [Alphaproteobacteria bacterium]|nr:response regulator [Alphaproteobacteria bacterium]
MAEPDQNDARVLVSAPIGRDALTSATLLQQAGLPAVICGDLDELLRQLTLGAAAVLVAEEVLFGKNMKSLCEWIERQGPWSDIPFVVLTSRQQRTQVSKWRDGLVSGLRNVTMLERPIQSITLTSTMHAAVRARLRQYEVRSLLEDRERTAHDLEALVTLRTSELEKANTELRAQMAERVRMEETVRQAQKIEALGQLTGGIAHDFNNLLMVITGGLDMLGRTTDPNRKKVLIDGMRQAAQRGAGLTRQLLTFSRRQSLRPQTIDIARQIGGMQTLLDRSLRGDVHVALQFAPDLWPVEADPGELEFAVLNLAVNARDAMPAGGTITIRADNAPDQSGKDFVRLSIIDTGSGMSPEVKAHVFEPFFTTKEVGKGSGLGLAQVHGFALQSGGAIQIESEIGCGTKVSILLPRSHASPAETNRLDEVDLQGVAARQRGTVLLVEDDAEVSALVTGMLSELGFDVVRTANAAAALGALADGRHVDVVLSDIMMPGGMDGVALARQIRMRRPGLPVLLTSGYAPAFQSAAIAEGVQVLSKPYRLNDLAAALAEARQPGLVLNEARVES